MIRRAFHSYPILRGIVSYAVIWPTASLVQQTMAGRRWHDYDWQRCLRFGLYGALFTAPTLYGWVRLSSRLWKPSLDRKVNIKNALKKVALEQVTYGPSAMACFFFAMELMETHSVEKATHEVQVKFWPTFQTALCFWPAFQTFNFVFVAERNRVVAVSLASFLWTIFLSYMKQMDEERCKEKQLLKIPHRSTQNPMLEERR